MKIVSLVPSLTELLIDLDADVIGRTRFCIHPSEKIKDITIVGGTKNPNIEKIKALKPDLIVGNKEENNEQDFLELSRHFQTEVTDISTVADAMQSILRLGEITGKGDRATQLFNEIKALIPEKSRIPKRNVVYLIWKKPLMSIGRDTYIHDVLSMYGLENVFGDSTRYPEISFQDIRSKKPDLILLSSEPYPFSSKHIAEFEAEIPSAKTVLVNGEWFSWYGSRMIPAFRALQIWRENLEIKM